MKHHRLSSTLALTACLAVVCLATTARATVLTPDPSLPPFNGRYQGSGLFATYNGPGLTIALSDLVLTPLSLNSRTPSGPNELENFNVSLLGSAIFNGSPLPPVNGNGPANTIAFGKIGNVTGTFQTEMLSLSLSGVSAAGPFMLRESPTLPSLGVTTITAAGGGLYQIDSFFDIFTELSVDGGATWIPSSTGSGHVVLVPEPGTVLLLACGLGGALLLRRRANIRADGLPAKNL